MRISRLALVAVLAAAWAVLPSAVRANDDRNGDEETIEIRKRVRYDDRDGGQERERGPRGMRQADPEMREKFEAMRGLEEKTRELAKAARQGSDAEKAAAKAELRKSLGELFDAKLAMETAMLAKMEKQAAELKAKIASKKTSRDKAIESRLARMTGEGDDW